MFWSQILCRLFKSPSDETGNCASVCLSACKNITYAPQRSCSSCQSSVDYGHTKITQHALKVSRVFGMLKLDTTLKKKNMGRGTLAFCSNVHQRFCSPRQLGGLWQHPNINPACSNSVKSLQNLEVGHYTGEEHGQRNSGVWPE